MKHGVLKLTEDSKKKVFSILFFLFFCNLSVIIAQAVVSDPAIDSLAYSRSMQDSLSREYIFLNETRANPLLDSLRKHIVVEGNDFIRWMHFMDSLAQAKAEGYMPEAAAFKFVRPAWVVVVLLLLILGIGLVRLFFTTLFRNIVQAYYDKQVLQNISKEDSMLTSWPYIFLYVLFSFSLALFLLVYVSSFMDMEVLSLSNFFRLSGIVALLFATKILLLRMIASVFEIERLVREYIVVLYLVYFNSMLILIPGLLIFTFAPVFYFKFLLILFSGLVSVLFLYRFFMIAFHMLGQLKFSIFYLILYLCTLEIAPILILVKMLSH